MLYVYFKRFIHILCREKYVHDYIKIYISLQEILSLFLPFCLNIASSTWLFIQYQQQNVTLIAARYRKSPCSSKLSIRLRNAARYIRRERTKSARARARRDVPAGSNYPSIIRVRGNGVGHPPHRHNRARLFLLHLISLSLSSFILFRSGESRRAARSSSPNISRARRTASCLRLEIRDAISKHSTRAPLYY